MKSSCNNRYTPKKNIQTNGYIKKALGDYIKKALYETIRLSI